MTQREREHGPDIVDTWSLSGNSPQEGNKTHEEIAREIITHQRRILEESGKNLFQVINQAIESISGQDGHLKTREIGSTRIEMGLRDLRIYEYSSPSALNSEPPIREFRWIVPLKEEKGQGLLSKKRKALDWEKGMEINLHETNETQWSNTKIKITKTNYETREKETQHNWVIENAKTQREKETVGGGSSLSTRKARKLSMGADGDFSPKEEIIVWGDDIPTLRMAMLYWSFDLDENRYYPRAQRGKIGREAMFLMTIGKEDSLVEETIRRENLLTEKEKELLGTFDRNFDILSFTREIVGIIAKNTDRIIEQIKASSA